MPTRSSAREGLRHAHVDAHGVDVGDLEQLGPLPLPALISAPISVLRAVTTPSNGAVIRLKFSSARNRSHIRPAAAGTGGCLGGRVAGLLIGRLLRTRRRWRAARCQRWRSESASASFALAMARSPFACASCWSRSGVSIIGQQLARLHLRADILIPHLHIAADPGVDRRLVERLHVAGQHQVLRQFARVAAGPRRPSGTACAVGPAAAASASLSLATPRCRAPRPLASAHQAATRPSTTCDGGVRRDAADREVIGAFLMPQACARTPTSGRSADAARRARVWARLKTTGTNSSVATVANISPPITARPSGAFCSALSAIGAMPMIIASAVISTGRKRVKPASIAAVSAIERPPPAARARS